MEKKQHFTSFLTQVITIYGSIIIILNIFCLIFGENAKEFSSIFSLGKSGLSAATSMQFLALSVIMAALRILFLTDSIIKKLSVTARTALMFASVFAAAVVFIIVCGWFRISDLTAWLLFILSFGVSAAVSTLTSAHREKQENEMLDSALKKLKEEL